MRLGGSMHTPSSGTQQITGQQAAVKTQVIDRGGWSSWARLAFVALAVMLITGLIAWSVVGGGKKPSAAGGSVHHAADGGVASDDKPVVEATKPPTVALDLSPLNTSLNELNTTLGGMGDSIASKVGEKMDESNEVIVQKLDQLLAQQAKPDDSSGGSAGDKTDDTKVNGGSDAKPPCDDHLKALTIEDRVGALETWRTGVDKTLKRHTRQIRRINDRLGQLSGAQVTDLPGYKTAVATHSAVVHLKYDK